MTLTQKIKNIIDKATPFLNKLNPLIGTRAAALYMLIFAAAIGIATFIENDFGTSSAQKVVFKTLWFELLLVLFSITLVANIVRFRMVQNKKWALVLFHTAIIIIFIGAGVTRYFGYEGMMHIREGGDSNIILSSETYLQFEAINQSGKHEFDEKVLFATLGNNNWNGEYIISNQHLQAEVKRFIPNPVQSLEETDQGKPTLKIVFGTSAGREEYFISQGETKRFKNVVFNFGNEYDSRAINLNYVENNLSIQSNRALVQTVMATQKTDTLQATNTPYPLRLRSLYSDGLNSFVFGDFNAMGEMTMESESRKVKNESMTALEMELTLNGETQKNIVFGKKGISGRPAIFKFRDASIAVRYGAKPIELPFKIKLYDFIMERYPGTNSAASYASEVQLIDPLKNYKLDYRIFMNNILDYNGFRFFQSSFDKDEKGSYLSVNHDFWGTWISYLGYFLLTLGLIMVFFSKKTRFYQVRQSLKKSRLSQQTKLILLLILASQTYSNAEAPPIEPKISIVAESHADIFSQMVTQDHKGRMKPLHTLSRELLRKVARKESMYNLTADQIILSMFANKQEWLSTPLIKLGKHEKIKLALSVDGDYASYKDFFETSGSYKLREEVRRAYSTAAIDRGMLEKELLKIDERVNIVSMIFSGRLLKIVPIPNDPNNVWVSDQAGEGNIKSNVAEKFFPAYKTALSNAINTNNYSLPNQLLSELSVYQIKHGQDVLPSNVQIQTEVYLNKLNVFNRLSLFYFLLGLAFLALLITNVFYNSTVLNTIFKILTIFVFGGFLFHTLGLGMRWYVSERAPWSNGYESMIYIGWTTTLAGVIFTRKSAGGLAATMILAGSILLVAMLSYLDPEITPLVPVLRSYWLTIHVSLIAGSYGFLMLGAIIGVINLILMILVTNKNKKHIVAQIKELSNISEITLTAGLVMISIGTYLGGVWANESWGRYWGWDAKETWALVTILVYAFILHMRLIPGINGKFAFNVATLFGMASVIMTYFGVNYYLSGLHSYAAGDPVPIPHWVYMAVAAVTVISIAAFIRKRKFGLS